MICDANRERFRSGTDYAVVSWSGESRDKMNDEERHERQLRTSVKRRENYTRIAVIVDSNTVIRKSANSCRCSERAR